MMLMLRFTNYMAQAKKVQKKSKKFPNAINSDGSVNRESLSKEVLEDPEKIKILENIIHPLVGEDREKFFKRMLKLKQLSLIYLYCLKQAERNLLILLLLLMRQEKYKRKEFCLDQT